MNLILAAMWFISGVCAFGAKDWTGGGILLGLAGINLQLWILEQGKRRAS